MWLHLSDTVSWLWRDWCDNRSSWLVMNFSWWYFMSAVFLFSEQYVYAYIHNYHSLNCNFLGLIWTNWLLCINKLFWKSQLPGGGLVGLMTCALANTCNETMHCVFLRFRLTANNWFFLPLTKSFLLSQFLHMVKP